MTTTAVLPLRPLSLGQLLDRAFSLYRQNFATFIGIILIAQIPVAILDWFNTLMRWAVLTNANSFSTSAFASAYTVYLSPFLGLFVNAVQFVLVQSLAAAAITSATGDSLFGQPINLLDAYRHIRPVWLRLFVALVLAIVASLGLVLWFVVPLIGWLTGIGMLYFFSRVVFRFLWPVVILEGKFGRAALRRSWDLARRRFWWLAGFAVVLFILSELILDGSSALVTYVTGWLIQALAPGMGISQFMLIKYIAQAIVALLMTLVYVPFESIVVTLVYFDLRIRTEGLDLALMAGEVPVTPTRLPIAVTQAPPPENTGIVSWRELLKFAALSLGPIAYAGFIFSPIYDYLINVLR